jgi:hypothetical protein
LAGAPSLIQHFNQKSQSVLLVGVVPVIIDPMVDINLSLTLVIVGVVLLAVWYA